MSLRWWPLPLVVALSLVACGGGAKPQTPEPSRTPAVAQPSTTSYPPATASPEPVAGAPTTTPEATSAPVEYLEGVFVVPADGSGAPVKLAEDGDVEGWSPDGTLIAVTTLYPVQGNCEMQPPGCFRDLSIVRADGRRQSVSLGTGKSPEWSADGKRLLFYRIMRDEEVCVADVSTGKTAVLASMGPERTFHSDNPAFSPDESRVLFSARGSLYVVKSDASEPPTKLADASALTAHWSPDSRRVVYSSDDRIYTAAADGGEPPRDFGTGRQPQWSPDGSRIAVEDGLLSNPEVWLIDPQTGERAKLADGSLPDVSTHSAWSPDGSLLAYARDWVLYTVGPRAGPVAELGQGETPVWSPDGKRIAFRGVVPASGDAPGGHGLVVINADGSDATLLADDLAFCVNYDWSPDSQQIAFSSTRCEPF